jgi:hypothetical protein
MIPALLIHFGHPHPLATEREFAVDVVYAPFALKEGLKARVLRTPALDRSVPQGHLIKNRGDQRCSRPASDYIETKTHQICNRVTASRSTRLIGQEPTRNQVERSKFSSLAASRLRR